MLGESGCNVKTIVYLHVLRVILKATRTMYTAKSKQNFT